MKVIKAKSAGFCFGVKRAVDTVYEQVKENQNLPIYTYGPIIHNEEVVKDLEQKGVIVLRSEEELDTLEKGTVIIRSHGVAKDVYDRLESKKIQIVDATCPFVKKIHNIVQKHSEMGENIIIIGNPEHPEVQGIKGWAGDHVEVFQTKEEAENYSCEQGKKICIVAQTTFNYNKFKELVEILEKKSYDVSVLNTICNATKERQTEAQSIAETVDAMIVIGDKHSSNTQKLFEICRKACNNTYYIQTLGDLEDVYKRQTHYTSGVASMTYMKAVEAGADIIDTAMSPFALGTSQPATEVMVETFKGTPYDTGLDQSLLAEIADYFRPIRDDALESGLLNPKNLGVNIKTLLYQVPGGMLSNLTSQLKEQGAEDKFYEVLEEVPRVRKDLGEPPLVTPSSQIVGTQAVFNVLMGERYKMITKETKDVLAGKYGKTTKPVDPELQKKALGDEEPITCRPADLIPDELDTLRKECAQWIQQDEDVLTYALFPQVAVDFFKYRQAQQTKIDATVADTENGSYPV